MARPDIPHLPQAAPIEGYGRGGFRFAGMSHRGSLLCLPGGIWAWPVTSPEEIDGQSLSRVFEDSANIGLFLLGTGIMPVWPAQDVRQRFAELKITLDVMRTAHAANTYNILLGEGRRIAAGLIAVD